MDARRAYALWAQSYATEPSNVMMEMEQRAMLDLLPDPAGSTALDLACGAGRYLRVLRERGASRVVGCDVSREMLARAARGAACCLVQADLRSLPLRVASVDLVLCGLAIGHVKELGAALREIARVLVPGGAVVYSDVHPRGARAGWKRTFRGPDGRQRAIEHHVHRLEDHERACRAAKLTIEAVREPRVEVDGPWRGWPAVLALRARRAL
jgi:malonyl-CoA O-methyltransferase